MGKTVGGGKIFILAVGLVWQLLATPLGGGGWKDDGAEEGIGGYLG